MLLPSSLRGFQPAGNSPTFARPKSSISLQSSSAGITGGATSMTGNATARASSTPIRNWRITLRLCNREAISGPGATSGRRGRRQPRLPLVAPGPLMASRLHRRRVMRQFLIGVLLALAVALPVMLVAPPVMPADEDCKLIEDFGRAKVGEFPAGWKPRKDEGT